MMEPQLSPPPLPQVPSPLGRMKPASKRFIKKNPSIFKGMIDPFIVEEWISMLEKIFKFI